MPIPDFESIMLPLLKFLSEDKEEHSLRETVECLSQTFKLSEEERKELLPSGQQPVFDSRVSWARTYMKKAGFVETTKRAFFRITQRGLDVLKQNPPKINVKFLEQYSEFREWTVKSKDKSGRESLENKSVEKLSPEDALVYGYQELRQNLADELLAQTKACSPSFFERLVVELIVKMGYGGSRKDAGKAIGQSRDGGIDGIIKEDKLGLDVIYIQAKRWGNTVGSPEIQKFVGALHGKKATKGIFITTSSFTKDAQEYVAQIPSKIILIDGEELVNLMIDHDIGVSKVASYDVKKMDTDYFLE